MVFRFAFRTRRSPSAPVPSPAVPDSLLKRHQLSLARHHSRHGHVIPSPHSTELSSPTHPTPPLTWFPRCQPGATPCGAENAPGMPVSELAGRYISVSHHLSLPLRVSLLHRLLCAVPAYTHASGSNPLRRVSRVARELFAYPFVANTRN